MKVTLSKSQWQSIGKLAGWMKIAGGFGKLGKDVADAMEGLVHVHKAKSAEDIVEVIRHDEWMSNEIREANVSDEELLEYIGEMLFYTGISFEKKLGPQRWRKAPSVTYGGKRWFFVAFTQNGKRTVVWDREESKWAVHTDNEGRNRRPEVLGLFDTPEQAKASVENEPLRGVA